MFDERRAAVIIDNFLHNRERCALVVVRYGASFMFVEIQRHAAVCGAIAAYGTDITCYLILGHGIRARSKRLCNAARYCIAIHAQGKRTSVKRAAMGVVYRLFYR